MNGRERQHAMAAMVNASFEHDDDGKLVVSNGENPIFLDLLAAQQYVNI